jgi:hypothetical protein
VVISVAALRGPENESCKSCPITLVEPRGLQAVEDNAKVPRAPGWASGAPHGGTKAGRDAFAHQVPRERPDTTRAMSPSGRTPVDSRSVSERRSCGRASGDVRLGRRGSNAPQSTTIPGFHPTQTVLGVDELLRLVEDACSAPPGSPPADARGWPERALRRHRRSNGPGSLPGWAGRCSHELIKSPSSAYRRFSSSDNFTWGTTLPPA